MLNQNHILSLEALKNPNVLLLKKPDRTVDVNIKSLVW